LNNKDSAHTKGTDSETNGQRKEGREKREEKENERKRMIERKEERFST